MVDFVKFFGIVLLLFLFIFAPIVILNIVRYVLYLKDSDIRKKHPSYLMYYNMVPTNRTLLFTFLGLQVFWWLLIATVFR